MYTSCKITLFNINCNASCLNTALFLFVEMVLRPCLFLSLYKLKGIFCRTSSVVVITSEIIQSSICDNAVFLEPLFVRKFVIGIFNHVRLKLVSLAADTS